LYNALPWFDPFDAGHLCMAIAPRVAADSRDCFVLNESEFDDWVDQRTRVLKGYDPHSCFRRFRVEAGKDGRCTGILSGIDGVSFIVQPEPDRTVSVFVLDRLPDKRSLTIGQLRYLERAVLAVPRLDAGIFARLRAEALFRDWPYPGTTAI